MKLNIALFLMITVMAIPAMAAENSADEQLNSGFGDSYFAEQAPRGFLDPVEDSTAGLTAEDLADIAPAAGNETDTQEEPTIQIEEGADTAGDDITDL